MVNRVHFPDKVFSLVLEMSYLRERAPRGDEYIGGSRLGRIEKRGGKIVFAVESFARRRKKPGNPCDFVFSKKEGEKFLEQAIAPTRRRRLIDEIHYFLA